MEFRELTVADLPELMKLENELFPGEAWKEDSFRSELEGSFTDYFGVFDEGLVGYAGLSSVPASFSSDIQTLAVTSYRQGKGLGRLLVNNPPGWMPW
jgi:ribosomal protein S18 acetylase RimI-like enzyme